MGLLNTKLGPAAAESSESSSLLGEASLPLLAFREGVVGRREGALVEEEDLLHLDVVVVDEALQGVLVGVLEVGLDLFGAEQLVVEVVQVVQDYEADLEARDLDPVQRVDQQLGRVHVCDFGLAEEGLLQAVLFLQLREHRGFLALEAGVW